MLFWPMNEVYRRAFGRDVKTRVDEIAIFAAMLGLLAFALAIVGIYGVVSYLASQRTHEIGVRMALGADRQDIIRLMLQGGLNVVTFGLAAGVVVTLASSRVIGSFLFGVSPRDPLTLLTVGPLLGCVALIACAIPAWRAARVNPAVALHSE